MPRKPSSAARQLTNDGLLIETATTVRNMSERLFGGVGQPDGGAIHFIMNQHKELTARLEANKQEFLDRLEDAKSELRTQIDVKKKETDEEIKAIAVAQVALDKKLSRFTTAVTTIQSIILAGAAAFGLYKKVHIGQ